MARFGSLAVDTLKEFGGLVGDILCSVPGEELSILHRGPGPYHDGKGESVANPQLLQCKQLKSAAGPQPAE
jgi:hypothetical protein